jgi:hypothetical protein
MEPQILATGSLPRSGLVQREICDREHISRFCELYRGWQGKLSVTMRQTHARRAPELLCRFRKQPEPVVVLQRGAMALAQVTQATQPACIHELGEVHQHNRPLLPVDQDITPTAMSPLRRQNPREEPGALAAHAGICAGRGWQQPSLPRPLRVHPAQCEFVLDIERPVT